VYIIQAKEARHIATRRLAEIRGRRNKMANFGIVVFGGVTIALTQQAYCANAGQYRAAGQDANGAEYEIEWVTTEAWDEAQEAAKQGDVNGFAEDESNACDWDSPSKITKL
jgi:hypothetical protein